MSKETNAVTPVEQRKLAAIMFTDIVGFSSKMAANEPRMLRLLDVHNQLLHKAVESYRGTVIKTIGDAFLVDFPSVVEAVQCAQQAQAEMSAHNAGKEVAEQLHIRIGIHLGDIVQREGDVFGDGVNIASRLQTLAEPDTIAISDIVYRDTAKKIDLGTVVALGRPQLKNIAQRFDIYMLMPGGQKGVRHTLRTQQLKFSHRLRPAHKILAAALVMIAGALVTVRYFPEVARMASPSV